MVKNKKYLAFMHVLISIFLIAGISSASLISSDLGNGLRIRVRQGTSSNWAGYAVQTNLASPQDFAVNEVNGTWVVPYVDCSITPSAYSSFWIGIDGYSSSTVEQIGTDSDCSSGSPRYYAWYEMYPKFPVNIPIKISPGDVISADVKFVGKRNLKYFTLTIIDKTTGKKFTTIQKSNSAKRNSAEWVAEAPWSSGSVLPLADFESVNFKDAQVNINGISGAISNSNWQYDLIDMVDSSNNLKAKTSSLSSDGKSFLVTWMHS